MKNPYLYLLQTAWKYAEGRRWNFAFAYTSFVIANLILMTEPLVFAYFLNTIQIGGPKVLETSMLILGLYASLQFFFWIFHGFARVVERTNSFHITTNCRISLFQKTSELPLKWHKDHHSGEIMSRIDKAINAMRTFTSNGFVYIETIIRFVASIAAMSILFPWSGLSALIFGVIIMYLIFAFDKILINHQKEKNERWHKANAVFYDYVINIITVITLRLEKLAKNEVLRKIMHIFPIEKRYNIINEWKWFAISMGLAILNFVILALYVYQHLSAGETILIGGLVAIFQYAQRLRDSFFRFAWQYEDLVWHATDLRSLEPIIKSHEKLEKKGKKIEKMRDWNNIIIDKLSFKYEDEEHYIHTLKNIHVELKKGQKIAFVGESGSGKSTMMTLIRGLEDPDSLNLKIDGKEYASMRVLSDHVTLIPQEPEIFENTIKYNVTIGLRHSKKELDEVCKIARFENVLKRLPNGFKTNIKEKGVNLSGGEKQRLALARGLFAAKHSSIILMDEPTSSVDPENETKIYEGIFRKFKDQCIISSVHRLHLLPKFDMLYLFEKGEIVGSGSFDDLLKSNKRFQEIWKLYQDTLSQDNSSDSAYI